VLQAISGGRQQPPPVRRLADPGNACQTFGSGLYSYCDLAISLMSFHALFSDVDVRRFKMKPYPARSGCTHQRTQGLVAIACAILLVLADLPLFARQEQQPAEQSAKIPADQLDALVAPIALYPDPLLSQTLVASTYPLEIVQLQQWLQKNKGLDQKALVNSVSKQPWDPSIQAMAALPDVVKWLADDIQWTTDLGNAFLAQQSDVMDAVQRMRVKAQGKGTLVSNENQKVETRVIEDKTVVVVEQANPEVVYVPSYDPVAVYGPPVYPYPSIYYPYAAGGVIAASAISFGVGVAMGAAWGGGWGWGAGWGNNDIDMNINNNFNRSANISGNRTGRNTWQHNPGHRGGAPYSDRATANRFGSNARGDSLASRQTGARQQINRQGGNLGSAGDRGGLGDRGGIGGGAAGRSFGGGDSIGNRSVGSSPSIGNRGGFGAGSGGFSGSAARSTISRGSSSMGGGRSFGGGGGGGRRGGRR
jgi:hypothetical protein